MSKSSRSYSRQYERAAVAAAPAGGIGRGARADRTEPSGRLRLLTGVAVFVDLLFDLFLDLFVDAFLDLFADL